MLKKADIHINQNIANSFSINTSDALYPQVRAILLSAAEMYGIYCCLIGEEVTKASKKKPNKENEYPRFSNEIMIVGSKSGAHTPEALKELAKDIGEKLESFGLSVSIHI